MKKLLLVLLVSVLVGCAGTPFKWNDARKIEPGMTIDEVTTLVGKPTGVRVAGDQVIYVWVYIDSLSGSSRTLRVDFKEGKVVSAPVIPDSFQD